MEDVDVALNFIKLVVLALVLVPMSNILKKAGYSPWLVLLGLIPIVGFILFFVFAFSTWPRQRAKVETLTRTFE